MRTAYSAMKIAALVLPLVGCAPNNASRGSSGTLLAPVANTEFEACFSRTLRPTWVQDLSGPVTCGSGVIVTVPACVVLALDVPLREVGLAWAEPGAPTWLRLEAMEDDSGRLVVEFGPPVATTSDSAPSSPAGLPNPGSCDARDGVHFQGRGRDDGVFGIRGDWQAAELKGKFWLIPRQARRGA